VADHPVEKADYGQAEPPVVDTHRDRLLAGLTLVAGLGLILALPFALKAGSMFFLPTTAAIVVAIALVPLLEWFERHRFPSSFAALICILLFLTAANVALASIVVPAWGWVQLLPERIDQIQSNLSPLIDFYSNLEKFVNRTIRQMADAPQRQPVAPTAPPRSIVELFATSAPSAFIEMFYAILVIYFFLAGWTRTRRAAIVNRASFGGAMATARVIQNVVDDTSAYLGTITFINISLGLIVAGALYLIGMPTPLMWGGLVALLNFIPYLGPILAAALLALGGLMTFSDVWWAMVPAAIVIGAHLVEANAITPFIVGHRLTINPILILISLSFWGWVWGTPGALLAVPLLIIIQTVLDAAGRPDIAGFLFEHGTLGAEPPLAPRPSTQEPMAAVDRGGPPS
jgi:predicted PurR-regulated permease PerM